MLERSLAILGGEFGFYSLFHCFLLKVSVLILFPFTIAILSPEYSKLMGEESALFFNSKFPSCTLRRSVCYFIFPVLPPPLSDPSRALNHQPWPHFPWQHPDDSPAIISISDGKVCCFYHFVLERNRKYVFEV